MKKKLLITSSVLVLVTLGVFYSESNESKAIEKLREKHQSFLDNSPFKETQYLSTKERKAMGLPPNAYYEQLWDLTMDPSTGRPMPERLDALQSELIAQRGFYRGVSGDNSTAWENRGPNNQGGRTRGIMFDPNDIGNSNPADDYTRVFAGGVSGGLWVNDDITNSNSSWTLVTGMQSNISVTTIISDPNNSNIFYIGSGESFTSGAAVGRGVWKSTDAGVTWQNIFGGYENFDSSTGVVNGIFYINDLVARNVSGTTELYIAVGSAYYGSSSSPNNFNGVNQAGVYKSVDNGLNWSRYNIQHGNGLYKNPCDLEIDINNNIWFTTTQSVSGNSGGDIYRSTDGINFTLINTISNADRTELEVSSSDANRFWIAAEINGAANLYTTGDAFSTITQLNEPNDADNNISSTDYTRGQAFYDLPIEADQNGKLYVGGIDLFVSFNNGTTWSQISKWSNNPGLNTLNVPLVHADQHAIVFRPGGNGNQVVFGTDGGVYYSNNIASAVGNSGAIMSRNKDYNTTQFYYGTIDSVGGNNGDDLAGGTQDNGTQILLNGVAGTNPFIDPLGGDGGFTEIDDIGPQYAITTYPGNNHVYVNYPNFTAGYAISSGNGGSFINEAALDKNQNILYANSSTGGIRRIERISNFNNGEANVVQINLTNALLNSSPSAIKVSPYTTETTKLLVGLRNGRLLQANLANINPIWANISGSSFVGSISDIEFGQDENEIFVTMYNYGVPSIWRTTNGGGSWQNKEGNLPDMPVRCVLQNPLLPNEVILGTDLGIWATADISATNPVWVPLFNGMSDVTVTDLDLRTSDNVVLAATFGRGLFTGQFTDVPLSINDNAIESNTVKVYPTVSNGNITVSSTSSLGRMNMAVFNMTGQNVFSTTVELNAERHDVNLNLTSGIYLVKFSKGSYSETKKIIIK